MIFDQDHVTSEYPSKYQEERVVMTIRGNVSEIARKIRELRENKGISIHDMAAACGIGSGGIRDDEYEEIENGSNECLMAQNIAYICAKLGKSKQDLGIECPELDIDEIDAQEHRSDHYKEAHNMECRHYHNNDGSKTQNNLINGPYDGVTGGKAGNYCYKGCAPNDRTKGAMTSFAPEIKLCRFPGDYEACPDYEPKEH